MRRSPIAIVVSPFAYVAGALLGFVLLTASKAVRALIVICVRVPVVGIAILIALVVVLVHYRSSF